MKKNAIHLSYTKTILLIFTIFLFLDSLHAQAFLPLRSKYPTVATISKEDLAKGLGKTLLVVDARSKVEYNVIHIKGVANIEIGHMDFAKKLEKFTKGNKDVKIVFYCNGGKCQKSYKADLEAEKLGYKNAFAYDGGIFEWAKTYPSETLLMGKILTDKSKLITEKEFKARLLEKGEFKKQSSAENTMLIDIRDPAQRKKIPKFKNKIIESSMDKLVNLLGQKYFKDKVGTKTIYFFDAVGKQIRWLQYYLRENNYKNYYFLKGGVRSYFN